MKTLNADRLEWSAHALKRMSQRGLDTEVIELVMSYGRRLHSRRALFHVVGRKEIDRYAKSEPRLKELDGVQVVTTPDEVTVITTYRNHDLRAIRPNKRKHRHLH